MSTRYEEHSTGNFRMFVVRKVLWHLAIQHDAMPHDTMFAEFSSRNPWAIKLNGLNEPNSDVIGFRL